MTVWPDSFVQRGRPKGVCTDPSPPRVTPEMRADDARSALAYVRSLPFVDAKRVAVMGGSHGGNTTLATNVAGGRGATTGGNPAAWADAVIQVERFLQTYLKKRE